MRHLAGAETDLSAVGDADFSVVGADFEDRLGQRVALGDINGDNRADLLLCTRFFDPPGRRRAGAVFVFYGRPGGELAGRWKLSEASADLAIWGATFEDRLGMSYESPMAPVAVGRLNSDEFGDLVIGAPNASPKGRKEAGAVYVFFGRQDFPQVIDLAGESADLTILGATDGAHLGSALTLGDLDGDGMDDLILGSPLFRRGTINPYGRLDIVAGGDYLEYESEWDLAENTSDWIILGASEQEELGDSLASGDANGDGVGDLFIGVSGASVEPLDNRGKAYLFLGSPARLSGSVTDLAETSADCTLWGADRGDRLGHAVAMPRIFSTRYADLAVSAPRAFEETGNPEVDRRLGSWGAVYMVRGRAEFPERIDFSFERADVTIFGATNGDAFGYQLAGGCILGASWDDLAATSFRAERSSQLSGEGVAVVFPSAALREAADDTIYLATPGEEIRIWGGRSREALGTGLAVGDVSGEGREAVLIGAPDSRDRGGQAYLFYSITINPE